MAKSSSLSDPQVIDTLNRTMVAVEINVTDQGFPKDVPGLKPWERAFSQDRRYRFGFATSVVLTPDGTAALGTSGCGHRWEWETSINYHAEKFRKYLEGCLDRFVRLKSGDDLAALRKETIAQIREANRCRRPDGN